MTETAKVTLDNDARSALYNVVALQNHLPRCAKRLAAIYESLPDDQKPSFVMLGLQLQIPQLFVAVSVNPRRNYQDGGASILDCVAVIFGRELVQRLALSGCQRPPQWRSPRRFEQRHGRMRHGFVC